MQYDGKFVIDVLRSAGLTVLQLPHFAQNFQQRTLYTCNPGADHALLEDKPNHAKYAGEARRLRAEVMRLVNSIRS
ncbi:MAG: hypothetical protein JSR27_05125 [Proteobacteria bacterium]|nr:hypothetical protein [Pseudomonadota bacterium]